MLMLDVDVARSPRSSSRHPTRAAASMSVLVTPLMALVMTSRARAGAGRFLFNGALHDAHNLFERVDAADRRAAEFHGYHVIVS
ncbi:MAG: hypothetical protein R2838_16965 [Caldilineaceae bacterium]